jgi:hypothetical protein
MFNSGYSLSYRSTIHSLYKLSIDFGSKPCVALPISGGGLFHYHSRFAPFICLWQAAITITALRSFRNEHRHRRTAIYSLEELIEQGWRIAGSADPTDIFFSFPLDKGVQGEIGQQSKLEKSHDSV